MRTMRPGEHQVAPFLLGGLAPGRAAAFITRDALLVMLLDQQAAGHTMVVQTRRVAGRAVFGTVAACSTRILVLAAKACNASAAKPGAMTTSTNCRSSISTRGSRVHFVVEGNDAAERRYRVGGVGAIVSLQQVIAQRGAAGVGVFDDDAGRPRR